MSLEDNSLQSIINHTPEWQDKKLARAHLALSMRNLNRSYVEATRHLDLATQFLEAQTDEAAFAQAMRCQVEHRQGLPDAADQCEALTQLGYKVRALSVLAYVRLTQSLYSSREGKHELAEDLARESAELAQASRNSAMIVQTNNWLAVQYDIRHQPKLSLVHYAAAWEAVETLDWQEQKQVILFNVAVVYGQLGRHEEAMAILEEAVTWPISSVNATRRIIAQAAMTTSLIGTGDALRAEQDLQLLVPGLFANVQNDTKILAYHSLAEAQLAQNKLDQALGNFRNAINLFDKSLPSPNPRGRAALVPYSGALRRAGRPQEALTVIDGVIAQLSVDPPNNLLRKATLERAATLTDLGDLEGAARATSKAIKIAEQLDTEALNYEISRLKMSIELEQSNQKLLLAQKRETALQSEADRETTLKYFSIALGALLLAIGYLLFSRYMQAQIAQTERLINEQLEEKVQRRTEQLEDQMADRLNAEVEHRHLLGKLGEGETLRALGQLTAGVAHDFNNLMTTVTLTTEYLKSSTEESQETRDALCNDILSATDSAARITGGLLAYARQQPLQPTVLQLDEFLEESTLIFRNTLGERNLLRTSFEPCQVKVDRGQLASALLNLVLNAKEAIGESGTVDIRLHIENNSDAIGRQPENYAVVTVTDSGRGMTDEELERATEPFYTTKESGEGAGLGLSMVFGFARQSGGDFSLKSKVNQGTQVGLRLPLEHQATASHQLQSVRSLQELPPNLKILVVEDRVEVLTMLQRSLEHLGLEIFFSRTS